VFWPSPTDSFHNLEGVSDGMKLNSAQIAQFEAEGYLLLRGAW
jgi:hypothetical protein